ncbi:MAG: Flp/Fap pilin component [Actinomycetia bacterium]|jgi:pilus assembly protein Flp/PilA|nr:Flp/Fap pilin component [Actinomycetes bacterium]
MIDNVMLQLAVRIQTLMAGARDRDRGATAVEYGLLIAAIVVIISAAVYALGGKVLTAFNGATTAIH